MFERSRARICLLTADSSSVLAVLDRYHRKWSFQPSKCLPDHLRKAGSQVVRQLYWRGADETCPWLTLAIYDLENAFATGYMLANALPNIPVVVLRTHLYGDFQLKAYFEKDCILKLGDDADHELAWLPIPLEQGRIETVRGVLGGEPEFSTFLSESLEQQVDPRRLERALKFRQIDVGFSEIQEASVPNWQYLAWLKSA